MQGSLFFSLIIQFASVDFVMNTPLVLFTSVLQVALNYRIVLLTKQL